MWATMTEPQAMIISALITVVAAVVGVVLGSWLFGGRVKDLQSALDASKQTIDEHRQDVDASLAEVRNRLKELGDSFAVTTEAIGQLRGSVGELAVGAEIEEAAPGEAAPDERARIRTSWEQIRDTLETIAADPRVDGRRRAKYARIDRRNYNWLIDSLDQDGHLHGAGDRFRESVEIWHKFRSRRTTPQREDADRMAELEQSLTRLSPVLDFV